MPARGVTQLCVRCGGFRLLPTVHALRWDVLELGGALPCPSAYNAAEYGAYVDCVVRHLYAGQGQFRDEFAERARMPRIRRAYSRARGPHVTAAVLSALFTVSKAKQAFINGEPPPSKFSASIGVSWLARLAPMLAKCTPTGPVQCNFGVRVTDQHGNSVYGEPDALVGATVIELKASKSMQCSSKWKCQALMYAALLRHNGVCVSEARIVNVSTGLCLRAQLASWSEHETLAWACSKASEPCP